MSRLKNDYGEEIDVLETTEAGYIMPVGEAGDSIVEKTATLSEQAHLILLKEAFIQEDKRKIMEENVVPFSEEDMIRRLF